MPVPFWVDTFKRVGVAPKQTVLEVGWVKKVGDAFTVTWEAMLVTVHPPAFGCEMTQ